NAYAYERKHKISERVVSHGLDMADARGEKRVTVTEAISGITDDKAERIIGEAGAWIVEEVVGGVNEGITEGTAVFEIARDSYVLPEDVILYLM
ncbi:hypothetical protein F5884DRAFT_809473, partial [Xylogone sp. PMI_703]